MHDTPTPESATRQRYAAAASQPEAALCCPVNYDAQYLKVIPQEVIEKDYGCGDPSKYLQPGDTVLDLGSGTGKICFIAAQVVGPEGRVIGVDMTDAMLEVARRNAPLVAEKIGYDNIEFRKGRIQDLALDLDALDAALKANPIGDVGTFLETERLMAALRREQPLMATASVDVVVSNCVLNLVDPGEKNRLLDEIFRVLKPGGRAVISDIVSDEAVPQHLQEDPELWSGCISGAYTEAGFVEAFERAGFYGIEVLNRDSQPWRTVEGIEFRSVTIRAWRGAEDTCLERNQAVIYRGPFRKVIDDDGNAMERGLRYAVCAKTYDRFRSAPYREHFAFVEPRFEVRIDDAAPFDCSITRLRDPRETKGVGEAKSTACCSPSTGESCC